MQLASKMRYIAAQFDAFLENDFGKNTVGVIAVLGQAAEWIRAVGDAGHGVAAEPVGFAAG